MGPQKPERWPAPLIKAARGLEHFEILVTQLTGCKVGDGTLQVTDDRNAYVNPHIQWLWERYQARSK